MNQTLGDKMTKVGVKRGLLVLLAIGAIFSAVACAPRSRPTPPPAIVEEMPEEEPFLEHTVRYSGESLALIAQWYTGRSKNWSVIRDANPGLKPERIRLGQRILIPRALVVKEDLMPQSFVRRGAAPAGGAAEVKQPQAKDESELPKGESEGEKAVSPVPAETPSAPPSAAPQSRSAPPAASKQPQGSDDAERERLLDELLE